MAGIRRHADAILNAEPQDPDALEALGIVSWWEGDAAKAERVFAQVESLRHGERVQARAYRSAMLDPGRAARGEPYVAVLQGAVVEPAYWMVLHGKRAFSDETSGRRIANSPFVRHRVSADRQWLVASVPRELTVVEEPCVLVGSDDNYSHWITRYLLKLSLIAGEPRYESMRLLMQEELLPWQLEYLELLGIPRARILGLPKEAMAYCRELHIPTQLRHHPQMGSAIEWLRTRLLPYFAPPPHRELLYVSRRDARERSLLNEAELARELAGLGFRLLAPGELPVRAQIAAFSAARGIVGPHGAGMTNLVFAPASAFVVEINSARLAHMPDFQELARVRGLRFSQVISTDYGPEHGASVRARRDYYVDAARVLDEVRRMESG